MGMGLEQLFWGMVQAWQVFMMNQEWACFLGVTLDDMVL